jgi:hypothetical protein
MSQAVDAARDQLDILIEHVNVDGSVPNVRRALQDIALLLEAFRSKNNDVNAAYLDVIEAELLVQGYDVAPGGEIVKRPRRWLRPLSSVWGVPTTDWSRGVAIVSGKPHPLGRRSLLLIEHGEQHEVRNTGRSALKTLNFYSPPGYTKAGDELPAAKPEWGSSYQHEGHAQTKATGRVLDGKNAAVHTNETDGTNEDCGAMVGDSTKIRNVLYAD